MSQYNTALMTLIILLFSIFAHAQASRSGSGQASKRWTLQEWLNTKNRNALMDQWLQINSPSPFEFYIRGESFNYETKIDSDPKTSYKSTSGAFAAYASLVGLQAEYENSTKEGLSDVTGLLNFRILGGELQSTSLILSVGQRTRQFEYLNLDRSVKNLATQAQLNLYLTKYFGIKGLYRLYLPSDEDASIGKVYGYMTEGGIYIDFSRIRVFGDYFEDHLRMTPTTGDVKIRRHGVKTGLQIFF